MQKDYIIRLNRRQEIEAGFTLAEALAALAIFSFLTIIIAVSFSTALKSENRTSNHLRGGIALLRIDDILRQRISRIRTPWFHPPASPESGMDAIRLNWLDGIEDKTLSIEWLPEESLLKIDDGENQFSFPRITDVLFEQSAGFIKIIISTVDTESVEYIFPTGAFPLTSKGSDL